MLSLLIGSPSTLMMTCRNTHVAIVPVELLVLAMKLFFGQKQHSIVDLWKVCNGIQVIIILPGSIRISHSQAISSNKRSLSAIVYGWNHTFHINIWIICMYQNNIIRHHGFYNLREGDCCHLPTYIFHEPFLKLFTLSIILIITNCNFIWVTCKKL